MNLLVIDLECTMPPIKRTGEIIQAGMAVLSLRDTSSHITQLNSIYFKPERTTVTKECEDLTGITQKMLEFNGVNLKTGMGLLSSLTFDWWGSWGMFDYNKLDEVCYYANLAFPFPKNRFTNIKSLFSLTCLSEKSYGLNSALDFLGLQFEGRPHDGGDDAYNTARIVQHILGGSQ